MKRKQRERVEQETKNIEYLERKLEDEKAILKRENQRLQKQIYQEIDENNMMKIKHEKKERLLEDKIARLILENQKLQTELLRIEEAHDQNNHNEDETLEALTAQKEIMEENAYLKSHLEQYETIMSNMEEENKKLQTQARQFKTKAREQMEKNKALCRELQEQSSQTRKELEAQMNLNEELQETVEKLESSNARLKKKNKEFTETMDSLESKFHHLQTQELASCNEEIRELKRQKQSLEQEIMTLNRKIQFQIVELNQKEACIEAFRVQIKNLNEANSRSEENAAEKEKRSQELQRKISQLKDKLTRSENQNGRNIIELQNERSRHKQVIENLQKKKDQEVSQVRKKLAQDMERLFQTGEVDNQNIEAYMEGLRGCKSHANMRPALFSNPKLTQERSQPTYQNFKQINNLKKENEILHGQVERLKISSASMNKQLQTLRQQNSEYEKQVRELSLTIDRNERNKAHEQKSLREQINGLRARETQFLQKRKQFAEIEEAMNLKVAYYDKKVKEYLDTIDRKENIIQNLKQQRGDLQNKAKFMEDKLAIAIEEAESLRKFKNDTNRKDELVRDYKDRLEKSKKQIENLKQMNDKLKKDKVRIQRNLQSKQDYIKTLKDKNAKQSQDKSNIEKEEKAIKQLKEKYQIKYKKLKKQNEQYGEVIESLRTVVIAKIQQSIRKYMGRDSGGGVGGWQAAQMLGLKESEIEEFVNPTVNLDRHICEDLDNLWEKGDYTEFMSNSIDYLILKNQSETLELVE